MVSLIDPSHYDAGTAWIAVDRHRLDDFKPYKEEAPVAAGLETSPFHPERTRF